MNTTFTYAQVIDLMSSELSLGEISVIANRQATKTSDLHFELNFFIL